MCKENNVNISINISLKEFLNLLGIDLDLIDLKSAVKNLNEKSIVDPDVSILGESVNCLKLSLKAPGVSVRIANVLLAENIKTIEDLICCTEIDLLRLPNIGRKSLKAIIAVLKEHGLKLGTGTTKKWVPVNGTSWDHNRVLLPVNEIPEEVNNV